MSDKQELTPAEQEKATILQNLMNQGNAYAQELGEKHGIGINPEAGKLDHFQMFLVEMGVLTREQLIDFEIKHMTRVNEQMNDILSQKNAQSRSAALIKPPSMAQGGLIGADGKRLI